MTYFHLAAITLTIILFIYTNYTYKQNRPRLSLWMHSLLRLSYVLVLVTGIMILPMAAVSFVRMGKFLLGVASMGIMEIYLMHRTKQDLVKGHKVAVIAIIGTTVLLGFFLPLGIYLHW